MGPASDEISLPILLISTELDEILLLSDRVAVMDEGEIVGVVDAARATAGGATDATPQRS